MITAAIAGRGAEMAVSKRALQATLHAIIHIANSQKYSNTLSILIDGRAEVLFCQHSFSKYFQFGNKQIIRTHFPRGKSGSDYIGLVPPSSRRQAACHRHAAFRWVRSRAAPKEASLSGWLLLISSLYTDRDRFAFLPVGQKLLCCRRPAGGKQHATGMLLSDGFDPGRHQKKPARWAGFFWCR